MEIIILITISTAILIAIITEILGIFCLLNIREKYINHIKSYTSILWLILKYELLTLAILYLIENLKEVL